MLELNKLRPKALQVITISQSLILPMQKAMKRKKEIPRREENASIARILVITLVSAEN